jgi:phage-related protein
LRLFCIHEGKLILLHDYVKKTQATPDDAPDLAMMRKKEIEW